MSAPQAEVDYPVAWKALPRADRALLVRAAMGGHRAINRWDAAITLWWTQRELRYGHWRDLIVSVFIGIAVTGFAWARSGEVPTSIGDVFAASPLLPLFVLIPLASQATRRPRLRRSAQLNAAVLAGRSFDGPPDPEEAERLLAQAKREGWFRGTRPQTDPDS